MIDIKENLRVVNENIKNICIENNKNFEDIILVAVSKTVDLDRIKTVIDAGTRILGENRMQEVEQKYEAVKKYCEQKNIERVKWHLIGHLQSNKAKKAVKMCDLIHSVDSLDLLKDVNRHARDFAKIQNVLVQVNMSCEDTKSGIEYLDAFSFFDEIKKNTEVYCSNVKIQGLMTIGPLTENRDVINECFVKTNILFGEIKKRYGTICDMKYLSMGMSSDYDLGIKNGANILRIGSKIFGERRYNI